MEKKKIFFTSIFNNSLLEIIKNERNENLINLIINNIYN